VASELFHSIGGIIPPARAKCQDVSERDRERPPKEVKGKEGLVQNGVTLGLVPWRGQRPRFLRGLSFGSNRGGPSARLNPEVVPDGPKWHGPPTPPRSGTGPLCAPRKGRIHKGLLSPDPRARCVLELARGGGPFAVLDVGYVPGGTYATLSPVPHRPLCAIFPGGGTGGILDPYG
jgi:hypothetical protein